ncbi:hypothetical protein [Acinetobacter sp.]|uniref:hypothetical protein n=1 Tax=Acinetobacter sp. TaxID=472 RepID=UPI0026490292|nr:hypothetical protein [Acinetobacter sp.]MDN5511147.1 hypothetical protein [Acinetobacter sp.]MDN5523960.1 hypothetical protein [Acinetobacter sp.]
MNKNDTESAKQLANEIHTQSNEKGGWLFSVLRRFGNEYFLESGDIPCKDSLQILIKRGLVFKVIHPYKTINTPDYGITHLGLQVYESIVHLMKSEPIKDYGIRSTMIG